MIALIIWRDPYKIVTPETLDKIAKVLGVDISELVETVADEERQHIERALRVFASKCPFDTLLDNTWTEVHQTCCWSQARIDGI